MSTYKVSYRSKETNRRRSKRIEAPSADAARQLIAPEATDVFSIEFVPPPLASDAQRDYLRAFGDRSWNDPALTSDQAHDLIEEFVAKDAPTNWSFRDSYPATEAQFEKYHYFGGKLNPDFARLTQGEMGRLTDRVRPREGQDAPNPVSPRQAMCLRFFFEPAVTDRFIRMSKKDVRLLLDAFYDENPGARKVWDSWKKAQGIPEYTYLVDPSRVGQNTYATLVEPPLSLNCLQTFKTQKQLDAEWEQRRRQQEQEAEIRHREAINCSKRLPSVDLSNVPYQTWSAAATAFKARYRKYDVDVSRDGSDRHNKQLTIELSGHASEDENDDHGLSIDVVFMLPGYVNGGWDCELSITVNDEKTMEYKCWQFRQETEYNTLKKVPTCLPFSSNTHEIERKAYEDFLQLLLSPAASESKAAKALQSAALYEPIPDLKSEPVRVKPSEPPPLPPADFSILAEKDEAPVKKTWWKFWQDR
jgi:hypothetical protein